MPARSWTKSPQPSGSLCSPSGFRLCLFLTLSPLPCPSCFRGAHGWQSLPSALVTGCPCLLRAEAHTRLRAALAPPVRLGTWSSRSRWELLPPHPGQSAEAGKERPRATT